MCNIGPKLILLFSGKRKSGKDTLTDILFERVKDVAVNIKLSAPIKSHFAKSQGLDFNELMGTGAYKEQYRLDMIKWSENIRNSDYGYFCRSAIEMSGALEKQVWVVTDMRRKTDLQWFRENYQNILTVKICSTEEEREKRGWIFTAGVDDQETECDLDTIKEWDIVIDNNGSLDDLEPAIDDLVQRIHLAAKGS